MISLAKSLLVLAVICLLVPFVSAQDSQEPKRVISNSQNWQDVYSTSQFSVLKGVGTNFLVSDRHATLLINQLNTQEHIWVISSEDFPQFIGYENLLNGRGFSAEEFSYDNVNLELAQELPDVTKFIIIDPSYGYNAISVAPYAAISQSYVLFADENNIDDITSFLGGRQVDSVIIYGIVDREVKSDLAQYNPEIINNNGDRFQNNVDIVKKYLELKDAKQVLLTNGEFIEQELLSGSEPVIFIGTNNVPDVTREFIQSSDIDVGVLVGNELVGTATFIRRQVGISVFVKFAQGARAPQGRISQVEALDMFYLPTYNLNLELESIKYNRATNELEITLRNTEDQSVYFSGTYSLADSEGPKPSIGDEEPKFIDGNEIATFTYKTEPLVEGSISGDVFIIYGESPGSLEKELRGSFEVETIEVLDSCKIRIDGVSFNLRKKQFAVTLENEGQEEECYADTEIIDLVIAGDKYTFGSDKIVKLKPGQKKDARIVVKEFEEEDIEDNENINVRVRYGERENSLIRIVEGKFELLIKKGDMLFYVLVVIIILLLLLIFWRRKKKKEDEEKHRHHGHHGGHGGHHPSHAHQHHQPAHHHKPAHHQHHTPPAHHQPHQRPPQQPAHHSPQHHQPAHKPPHNPHHHQK